MANFVFGNWVAIVSMLSASRKPAAMTRFDPWRTAVLKFGR